MGFSCSTNPGTPLKVKGNCNCCKIFAYDTSDYNQKVRIKIYGKGKGKLQDFERRDTVVGQLVIKL